MEKIKRLSVSRMRDRNLRETLNSDIAYCGTDNNAGILKSLTPDCVVLSPEGSRHTKVWTNKCELSYLLVRYN